MIINPIIALICIVGLYICIQYMKHEVKKVYSLEELFQLTPREFEFWCAEYLENLGYKNVKVTKATGDGGRDIICYDHLGRQVDVEVKQYRGTVGRPIIQKLYGAATYDKAKAMCITTSRYTKEAKAFAYMEGITLIDQRDLGMYLEQQKKTMTFSA